VNNPADRLARLFASTLAVDAMAPGDFRRETDLSPVRTGARRGVATLARPAATRRSEAVLTVALDRL
jgi:hypothetical protein